MVAAVIALARAARADLAAVERCGHLRRAALEHQARDTRAAYHNRPTQQTQAGVVAAVALALLVQPARQQTAVARAVLALRQRLQDHQLPALAAVAAALRHQAQAAVRVVRVAVVRVAVVHQVPVQQAAQIRVEAVAVAARRRGLLPQARLVQADLALSS